MKRHMIKDLLKRKEGQASEKREEDKILMSDDVGKIIVTCVMPLLKEPVPVRGSDNLELDLGLDSLQKIELVVSMEKAFSMKLPEAFAIDVQSVDELVRKIKDLRAKGIEEGEKPPAEDLFSGEITEKDKRRIGFKQGALERAVVAVLLSIARVIFKIFFGLRVNGVENLPEPPFIIAPNHVSNLDGFAIVSSIPRGIFKIFFFQGFQTYFTGWGLSLLGRLAHAIPIDPGTFLGNALRLSSYVLRNRRILCIFPEGGRSFDGKMMSFKKGVGILAIKQGDAVSPTLLGWLSDLWGLRRALLVTPLAILIAALLCFLCMRFIERDTESVRA